MTTIDPVPEPKQEVEEDVEGEIEKAKEEQFPQEPSGISPKPPVRYGHDEYADSATRTHHVHHVAYNVCEIDEPSTMKEVMKSDHAKERKAVVVD